MSELQGGSLYPFKIFFFWFKEKKKLKQKMKSIFVYIVCLISACPNAYKYMQLYICITCFSF